MIHADRKQVHEPSELKAERYDETMDQARDFYAIQVDKRSQQRFDFSEHIGWLKKVVTERRKLKGL